jgi:glutaminase
MDDMQGYSEEWSPIYMELKKLYDEFRDNFAGEVADYIPELKNANPHHFGIALATVDGQVYEIGDTRAEFTLQSISKAFVYGLALADYGAAELLKHVGVEPTGEAFNSIVLDEINNRPFNPMVNAGAIAVTARIKGAGYPQRLERILDVIGGYAGRALDINERVYASEKSTGYRNHAIAYLELGGGMIEQPIDEHLDLYFSQCSIAVTARDLSIMAASLANYGMNPLTSMQVQESEHISHILSVMQSCGMYDFSGEWSFKIGIPAKSAVSGGLIAVVPGLFGIGIYSPLLDKYGNSIRGVEVCKALSSKFNFHIFGRKPPTSPVVRRHYSDLNIQSKRWRSAVETKILKEQGNAIQVYELQGDLNFSSVEQLSRRLLHSSPDLRHLILDCRRIDQVDATVMHLLMPLKSMLAQRDVSLYVVNASSVLMNALKGDENAPLHFSTSTELVLEECENLLIASETNNIANGKQQVPLNEIDITTDFSYQELELMHKAMRTVTYATGDVIIVEGAAAEELFMLAGGLVSVHMPMTESAQPIYRRVGAISAGTTFGEGSLYKEAFRTRRIIADEPCTCYVLSVKEFLSLTVRHPEMEIKLLKNLLKIVADRCHKADWECSFFAE